MKNSDINNIYQLDGKVPVSKAIPFGLQHILAMFVANIAPIIIVSSACGLDTTETARLIQTAMIVAGIGSVIQLYPIWKVGSGLPIVMGISFTFVSVFCFVGPTYGYGAIVGAVIIGGIIEGILGLFAKYWVKLISPIVAASVVTAIGFSLLSVGATSFGGGSGAEDFGSAKNLILGTITLVCCIGFNIFAKSYWKQLSVLFGLIVGYIVAVCMGMVDFSGLSTAQIVSLPQILPIKPTFNIGAIISVLVIFLVSATETIGDTSALASSGLNREVSKKELTGSIAADGFVSALSGLFGCLPITSFSQNVGLVSMTKVVNRFTIFTGCVGELIGAADNECGEGVLIVGTLKAVLQFLVAACQFIVILGVAVFGKRVVIFFRCDDIDLDLDIQSQHVEKCLFQQGIVGVHNNGFLELGLYGEHCHRAVQLYRLHNIDPELHGSF